RGSLLDFYRTYDIIYVNTIMKEAKRREAVVLRRQGYSLNEIAEKLKVAKSTVSLWARDIELSPVAVKRLMTKIKRGQFLGGRIRIERTRALEQRYLEEANLELVSKMPDSHACKLLCAMIYWCEGTKNVRSGLTFTNSDPSLVKCFLNLLRASFPIDEKLFHPCVHLHEYHSPSRQIRFWSGVTGIPINQFIRPYIKPHTGKRIHDNYPGCISLKYHNVDLARRVQAVAKAFLMT
ncbi:MAG: helix-turn-helix domain-containing protein, partial [Patescibacteria group bacterium]